jgi:hypothetical protein
MMVVVGEGVNVPLLVELGLEVVLHGVLVNEIPPVHTQHGHVAEDEQVSTADATCKSNASYDEEEEKKNVRAVDADELAAAGKVEVKRCRHLARLNLAVNLNTKSKQRR